MCPPLSVTNKNSEKSSTFFKLYIYPVSRKITGIKNIDENNTFQRKPITKIQKEVIENILNWKIFKQYK